MTAKKQKATKIVRTMDVGMYHKMVVERRAVLLKTLVGRSNEVQKLAADLHIVGIKKGLIRSWVKTWPANLSENKTVLMEELERLKELEAAIKGRLEHIHVSCSPVLV